MKAVFLSGGTGTPKLLLGVREILPDHELAVITNPGDDLEWNGLLVCPDLDTVLYLFSNKLDSEKFWGLEDETFNALETLKSLRAEMPWFNIGDKDLGLHVWRTNQLRQGKTLTEITAELLKAWNIGSSIFPPTNGTVRTHIVLDNNKKIGFQEFWVKSKGMVEIKDVIFEKRQAIITEKARQILESDAPLIIGPSNPVSSIGPILAVDPVRKILQSKRDSVFAISPFIGRKAFSGPAAKMISAKGYEPSSKGLAEMYSDVIGTIVIHSSDENQSLEIKKEGVSVISTDTYLSTQEQRMKLAAFVLKKSGVLENP